MKESTPVEPTPQFYLTFYNAYAGADNVIPKINGQSLLQNQNTYAFGSIQGLALVLADSVEVSYTVREGSNSEQSLVEDELLRPEENKVYSSIVYGPTVGQSKHLFLNDVFDNQSNETKPRVRFLNLAENVGAVDFYLGENKIEQFSGRVQESSNSVRNSEKFIVSPLEAASTDVIIKDAEGEELIKVERSVFNSNRYYTIALVGDANLEGENKRKLALKISTY